jgi:transcriptional regulator with XRE-family HTH domain
MSSAKVDPESVSLSSPSLRSGARLARVRGALGYSQRHLALEFGVTGGAIAHWETGARDIPGPILKLLALYEEQLWPTSRSSTPPPRRSAALAETMYRVLSALEPSPLARRVLFAATQRYAESVGKLSSLSSKLSPLVEPVRLAMPTISTPLQARPVPMPASTVAEVFVEELGVLPRQIFDRWEPEPFTLSTLGQVHRATLRDGREVAVKVQARRLVDLLGSDLEKLAALDPLLKLVFRWQAAGVVHEEVRARLGEECDFRIEADNQRQFWARFAHRADLRVPAVVDELSTRRILVSEWAPGESLETFVASATPAERERSAQTLCDFFFESVFVHQTFNTDPHPSNFRFDGARVSCLDFGSIKHLSHRFAPGYRRLMRAAFERDHAGLGEAIRQLGLAGDPARLDVTAAFKTVAACLVPWLVEGPHAFTAAGLKQATRHCLGHPNLRLLNLGSDEPWLYLALVGMYVTLSRFEVKVDCRGRMLDWLYPAGEPRPPAFTMLELSSLGISTQ